MTIDVKIDRKNISLIEKEKVKEKQNLVGKNYEKCSVETLNT